MHACQENVWGKETRLEPALSYLPTNLNCSSYGSFSTKKLYCHDGFYHPVPQIVPDFGYFSSESPKLRPGFESLMNKSSTDNVYYDTKQIIFVL